MSGLHAGVKFLSQLALCLGMVLTMLVFIMDDTKFLLNLITQEVGYYFQWSVFQLNFWTDAFGQLREGNGRATDGNAAAVWWMDAWVSRATEFVSWALSSNTTLTSFLPTSEINR
jgi:choline-glycine betaine transporter